MSDETNDFLSGWLDGDEPESSGADAETLRASRESVADALIIHGLLTDQSQSNEAEDTQRLRRLMERIDSEENAHSVTPAEAQRPRGPRRFAILTSALTIAAAALVMFVVLWPQQNVSAAMTSLEKVIEAAAKPFDRTYRVSVIEEYERGRTPGKRSQESWVREREEQIDGATLFVRGANQFVLKVMLRSGVLRTAGCDGKQSWSFRENSPVHVSTDLNRFRGGVPGAQQDLPFMNMHDHLSQLLSGYQVELTDKEDTATDGTVLFQLVGMRQALGRGPKQIKIWFAPDSGTVHRMVLDGLPRKRGGPKSVMLELEDHSDLSPDFFSHEAHHEPGRRIKNE